MNLEGMLPIGSIPTILPNIASTTLFETKITKNCHFLTGIDFNLLSMQKDVKCPRIFLASNDLQRVKYLHPVSILIKIGVLVRKKNAPKMLACENSRFSSLLAAGTSITSRRLDFWGIATFNVGIFAYFRRTRHQVYCFEPGLYYIKRP